MQRHVLPFIYAVALKFHRVSTAIVLNAQGRKSRDRRRYYRLKQRKRLTCLNIDVNMIRCRGADWEEEGGETAVGM